MLGLARVVGLRDALGGVCHCTGGVGVLLVSLRKSEGRSLPALEKGEGALSELGWCP